MTAVEPATATTTGTTGTTGTAGTATITAAPARPPGSHVPAADVVRVLTFACVIGVHTLSVTHPLDDPRADALVMLLHFTREAFFVLTAFVLMHRYGAAAPRLGPFWRRRFLLVGVPYVVWTAIYTGLNLVTAPLPPPVALQGFAWALLTGTAWYHLYFLLVSMQFYLVFPLFQRLLVWTSGRHGRLLLAALVLQVLVDLWIHDPAPVGLKADLLPYTGSFVGSYVFFLVFGGVVAMHRERVLDAVAAHPVLVATAVVLTGAAAEGWYLWAVAAGVNAQYASDVFQPVMIPWVVAVVAGFALLGLGWARSRACPRWVGWASERSFGVFLVHPVILWAMTIEGPSAPTADLPQPLPTIVVYVVAVLGALVLVGLFRATPLRMPLTGKSSDRSRR
ncbi:MAG TPA: acyltransferase [Pseudonocardia sp.]